MGYSKYFEPTKEAIEEVRKYAYRTNDNVMLKYQTELCVYCMLDHSSESISGVINKILGYLSLLNYAMRGVCYKIVADECEREGNCEFCGWVYSKNTPETTVEDATEYTLQSLVAFAMVVKTPDFFGHSEDFYEKKSEIMSAIEDYCEVCSVCADFEIIGIFDKMCPYKDEDENEDEVVTEAHSDGCGECETCCGENLHGADYDSDVTNSCVEWNETSRTE